MVSSNFDVEYVLRLRDMFSQQADKILFNFNRLRNAVEQNNRTFEKFHSTVKNANKELGHTTSGFKESIIAMRRHEAQARRTAQAYKHMGQQFMQVGRGIHQVGQTLSVTVGLPSAVTLGVGTKQFLDLDKQLKEFQIVSNIDDPKRLEQFRQLALRQSTRSPITAVKFMEGMTAFAQSGEDVKDIPFLTELVNKAGIAFRMQDQIEQISKFTSKGREFFNLGQRDTAMLLDFVNTIADSGIASEQQLIRGMTQHGLSSAVGMGINPRKMIALTSAGMKMKGSPEAAARIIDILLKQMSSDKFFGGKFRGDFKKDPEQALLGALELINKMNETASGRSSLSKMFAAQVNNAVILASQVDTIRKQFALADKQAKTFDMSTSGLQRAYLTNLESAGSYINLIRNNLYVISEQLARSLFNTLGPLLNKLSLKWLPAINDKLEQIPTWLKASAAGFLAMGVAIGPVVMLLGSFVNALGVSMIMLSMLKSQGLFKLLGGGTLGRLAAAGMAKPGLMGKLLAKRAGMAVGAAKGALGNPLFNPFGVAAGAVGAGAVGALNWAANLPGISHLLKGISFTLGFITKLAAKPFVWVASIFSVGSKFIPLLGQIWLALDVMGMLWPQWGTFMSGLYALIGDITGVVWNGLVAGFAAVTQGIDTAWVSMVKFLSDTSKLLQDTPLAQFFGWINSGLNWASAQLLDARIALRGPREEYKVPQTGIQDFVRSNIGASVSPINLNMGVNIQKDGSVRVTTDGPAANFLKVQTMKVTQ